MRMFGNRTVHAIEILMMWQVEPPAEPRALLGGHKPLSSPLSTPASLLLSIWGPTPQSKTDQNHLDVHILTNDNAYLSNPTFDKSQTALTFQKKPFLIKSSALLHEVTFTTHSVCFPRTLPVLPAS